MENYMTVDAQPSSNFSKNVHESIRNNKLSTRLQLGTTGAQGSMTMRMKAQSFDITQQNVNLKQNKGEVDQQMKAYGGYSQANTHRHQNNNIPKMKKNTRQSQKIKIDDEINDEAQKIPIQAALLKPQFTNRFSKGQDNHKRLSTFDMEANEADADLSANGQHTLDISPARLNRDQVIQGSMGSFINKGHILNMKQLQLPEDSSEDPMQMLDHSELPDTVPLSQVSSSISALVQPPPSILTANRCPSKTRLNVESVMEKDYMTIEDEFKNDDVEDGQLNIRQIKNKVTLFERKLQQPKKLPDDGKIPSIFHLQHHYEDGRKSVIGAVSRTGQETNISQLFDFCKNNSYNEFKIMKLDGQNTFGLKLEQNQYDRIPSDTKSFLKSWSQVLDRNESDKILVSIELSNNRIQELESALFMNMGSNCKNLQTIIADNNEIKYISNRIKDCEKLECLILSNNHLQGREYLPIEMISSKFVTQSLQYLYLDGNDLRELPTNLEKLVNLKVLDLKNNKIRSLHNSDQSCSLNGLVNLEQLFLHKNRLKDIPAIFPHMQNLTLVSLDWFKYMACPHQLPTHLQDPLLLNKLKKMPKDKKVMTFKQFVQVFSKDYSIDGGSTLRADGRTALHIAVSNDDQVMVNNLLNDQADPNLMDSAGCTPLGLAFIQNKNLIAKLFFKFYYRINFKSVDNSKMLLFTIERLNMEMTLELLKQGCNPNAARDAKTGETCLHILVSKWCLAVDQSKLMRGEQSSKKGNFTSRDRSTRKLKESPDNSFSKINRSDFKSSKNDIDSEVDKCNDILLAIQKEKIDVNQMCNQKYTPLLLAVRNGSIYVMEKLLSHFHGQIDMDSKGGFGQNTAFHFAATRTNFEAIFVLDQWGADIFMKNRENRTCFQLVNNNLLMLKVVKKIEIKQFYERQVPFMLKIQPSELRITAAESSYVNTGEYKQLDQTLQKIKREFLRAPTKRPSIFQSLTRQGRNSMTRDAQKNLIIEKNGRPPSVQSLSNRNNSVHNSSFSGLPTSNLTVKRTMTKTEKKKKVTLYDFLTTEEQITQTDPDQSTKTNAGDTSPQQQFLEMSGNQRMNIKLIMAKVPQQNVTLAQKGPIILKASEQVHPVLTNMAPSRSLMHSDSANILETDRHPLHQPSSRQHNHLKTDTKKLISEKIQLQIIEQNPEEESQKQTDQDGASAFGIQQKNIFFIKDQIFDRFRLKQVNYNDGIIYQTYEDDTVKLQQSLLEFQSGCCSFMYGSRVVQELKLCAQLRSSFNSLLKNHVNVLCEILDKLHKLKFSPHLLECILQLSEIQLLKHGQLVSKNYKGDEKKGSKSYNNSKYIDKSIRNCLDNQVNSVDCPQNIQEQIQDMLDCCPDEETVKQQLYALNIRKSKTKTQSGQGQGDNKGSQKSKRVLAQYEPLLSEDAIDITPSQKISKYTAYNDIASKGQLKYQRQSVIHQKSYMFQQRKSSHQLPHLKKNPLTNNSSKCERYQQIDEQFEEYGAGKNIDIQNEDGRVSQTRSINNFQNMIQFKKKQNSAHKHFSENSEYKDALNNTCNAELMSNSQGSARSLLSNHSQTIKLKFIRAPNREGLENFRIAKLNSERKQLAGPSNVNKSQQHILINFNNDISVGDNASSCTPGTGAMTNNNSNHNSIQQKQSMGQKLVIKRKNINFIKQNKAHNTPINEAKHQSQNTSRVSAHNKDKKRSNSPNIGRVSFGSKTQRASSNIISYNSKGQKQKDLQIKASVCGTIDKLKQSNKNIKIKVKKNKVQE